MNTCLAVIILFILSVLFGGLLVMLAAGLLHSVFLGVPALGYGASVIVAVALRLLVAVVR